MMRRMRAPVLSVPVFLRNPARPSSSNCSQAMMAPASTTSDGPELVEAQFGPEHLRGDQARDNQQPGADEHLAHRMLALFAGRVLDVRRQLPVHFLGQAEPAGSFAAFGLAPDVGGAGKENPQPGVEDDAGSGQARGQHEANADPAHLDSQVRRQAGTHPGKHAGLAADQFGAFERCVHASIQARPGPVAGIPRPLPGYVQGSIRGDPHGAQTPGTEGLLL